MSAAVNGNVLQSMTRAMLQGPDAHLRSDENHLVADMKKRFFGADALGPGVASCSGDNTRPLAHLSKGIPPLGGDRFAPLCS